MVASSPTGLQIRLEFPDLVKHLVDIGDQITLHGETGQRCELDDTQIVGILRLRGLNVFARMTEAVLIHLCVGRLLCPSLHRGGAQKRRRAVDGHGIGTAHAMTARITEGKSSDRWCA